MSTNESRTDPVRRGEIPTSLVLRESHFHVSLSCSVSYYLKIWDSMLTDLHNGALAFGSRIFADHETPH